MSRKAHLPKPRAGIYEAAAPAGYSDRAVVDHAGELMIRMFVRADVEEAYAIGELLSDVLESERPSKIPAPRLKVLR